MTDPQLPLDKTSFQHAITQLPTIDRARFAAMLADATMRGWLVEIADTATAELASNRTYEQVANELGVGVSMVNRRLSRHHQRQAKL